ncbi:MAG: MBL fold metallo-hydrolase [Lachnospira sp.]|nr:MBL fold metallo-hydrolase [Lachnospira sp.]
MSVTNINDSIVYIGADDLNIDLFESQYVVPEGVSYNSYLIKDSKIVVMDTVDERATDPWFDNLSEALDGKAPDYLVVSHLEPDHAANIQRFISKYPDTIIVGNAKTFAMMPQFFDMAVDEDKKLVVKEGDELNTGSHTLKFFMAPMVHWPEVMVTYDIKDKVLFSADGFGKFGAINGKLINTSKEDAKEWSCEARRYYINIVGKYGPSVQALLKKVATLDIQMIAPLHGPVLNGELSAYIEKYDIWSSYRAEDEGVTVAFSSLHGNTKKAALYVTSLLDKQDVKYELFDLSRDDMAEALESAFRYDKIVLLGVTYDGGLMPCMEDFLYHLKMKNFQNRKAAIVQNGSWGPVSGKLMKDALESMKNITVCEKMVTIKSVMNTENEKELTELIKELL